MMTVRKLEYLVALAKERHFARAAAVCHVSQPTLSTALRQLESELGVTIVKRGQRYSGLTEQGERVLAFAHRIAAERELLRRELESGVSGSRTLQAGVVPAAIPVVSNRLVPFHKAHPHVNVKLMELNPAEIRRGLEECTLDVAVTYLDERTRQQGRNHLLYVEEYSLLTRKGSALSARKSVSWEDASRLPLCLLAPEMLCESSPVRDLLGDGPPRASLFKTNSMTALRAHVRAGTWTAILPRPLALDLQAGGEVKSVPLPSLRNPITVAVVIPDRESTFSLAEAFLRALVSGEGPFSHQRHKIAV